MPKRFTATEKWNDPWFCSLTDNEKLFWLYLLDNCNHAGIWEPNWFMFGVYVKNFKFVPEHFEGRIQEVGKKWHIPKFIEFQYGRLNPENRLHASVMALLVKEGPTKVLSRSVVGPKDKDKDKDKRGLHKDKDIINKEKPDIPYQGIIDTFNRLLPGLPKALTMNKERKDHITARWNESPERQNIAWWEKFFTDFVLPSDFLNGKVEPRIGHKRFFATLWWILCPNNFLKVLEGNYLEHKPIINIHPSWIEADKKQKELDEANKHVTQEQMQAGLARYEAAIAKRFSK